MVFFCKTSFTSEEVPFVKFPWIKRWIIINYYDVFLCYFIFADLKMTFSTCLDFGHTFIGRFAGATSLLGSSSSSS